MLNDSINNGVPRGWILIDEAHNYVPAQGTIGSSNALIQYVNEGRNVGLSLAVTTQNPAGLHQSIQRNVEINTTPHLTKNRLRLYLYIASGDVGMAACYNSSFLTLYKRESLH